MRAGLALARTILVQAPLLRPALAPAKTSPLGTACEATPSDSDPYARAKIVPAPTSVRP